jgi:hypothetical protein
MHERVRSMSAERLVCTIAPVEAILRVAAQVPVFPCRRHPEEAMVRGERKLLKAKSPLTPRGLHDATQDPEQIRAWWGRWPEALVGVPTGSTTGLVVIDYDADKVDAAADEWIKFHAEELVSTRTHGTLSGGRHYLFRGPPGIEYRNGVCLTLAGAKRNGIDLRAEGGYIIWWPLHGGSSVGQIAPLPAALVDEQRIEKRELPPLPEATPEAWAKDRQLVADALCYLDPGAYDEWSRAGLAIHLASGGCDDGFALWHAWSAGELTGDCPANYSGINDCRYHWDSYRHDKARDDLVTLGSLFEIAKGRGYAMPSPSPELPPLSAYEEDDLREARLEREAIQAEIAHPTVPREPEDRPPPLRIVPMDDLATIEPLPIRFVIEPLLPRGFVSLLGGHGDAGKTMLALVMAAHVACGAEFAGLKCITGRVLFVSLEDSAQVIKLRLRRIAAVYRLDIAAIARGVTVYEAADDEDSALAFEHASQGVKRLVRTRSYEQLAAVATEHDFVIVDNASDAFDANENDRRLVRRFIRDLQRIGQANSAAVLLLAHLDKAGARFGTAGESYAGSTAWHNTARSRMALAPLDDGLELVHEKCNLAKKLKDAIVLERGDHGVPVPLSEERQEQKERADKDAVLAALRAAIDSGIDVPTAHTGPRTTAHVIEGRPEMPPALAKGTPQSRIRIREALAALQREGAISREPYNNGQRKGAERYVCAHMR